AERAPFLDAGAHDDAAVAARLPVLGDGDGLQFGEVGPGDMERTAGDRLAVFTDDEEVAEVLVGLAHGAGQHVATSSPEVHEAMDRLDVMHRGALGACRRGCDTQLA